MRGPVTVVGTAFLAMLLGADAGCANDCKRDADCPDGTVCNAGLCLVPEPGVGGSGGTPCIDTDGDLVCDAGDNCPDVANADQKDADSDRIGDACDPCPSDPLNDVDQDGVCGNIDICPTVADPEQIDTDGDGPGDACDPCPADPLDDADGDGVCGDLDVCPNAADPDQVDTDGDGLGDACDPCPADPFDDADGDGVCGDVDVCPGMADPDQVDTDGDDLGDACDPDDDNDGVDDEDDCAPLDSTIHPGAFDTCDGVDRDCVKACRWPVTAMGASHRIVDVSCVPNTRSCAVATNTETGSGSLLLVKLGETPSLELATAVQAPRGIAIGLLYGQPIAWVSGATSVQGINLDLGSKILEVPGGGPMAGPIASLPNSTLVVAAMAGSRFVVIAPLLIGTMKSDQCGADALCRVYSFDHIKDDSEELGIRLPRGLALREPGQYGMTTAYFSFADDSRVVVTTLSFANYTGQGSRLLSSVPSEAVDLLLDRESDRIYVMDGAGSGARITLSGSEAGHSFDAFLAPEGACPTALGLLGSRLAVGQDCGGGDSALLLLDLDEDGLPIASEKVQLPGCTPRRIAAVPSGEGLGPPLLAIACENANSLLVFGQD